MFFQSRGIKLAPGARANIWHAMIKIVAISAWHVILSTKVEWGKFAVFAPVAWQSENLPAGRFRLFYNTFN